MHAEGRLENNNIMCAYHAWSFNSQGNLVDVPQAHHSGDPDGNARACASRRGCVATYPVMVSICMFLISYVLAFCFFGSYHHLASPFKTLKIHS